MDTKYNKDQIARFVHEVLQKTMQNELQEFADKYNVPVEKIENIVVSLYVKDNSKVQWKSSKAKFIKIYEKEAKMLFDNGVIDWQEFGFLCFLAVNFTNYEDNTLRNEDGEYCTQKDIIEKSGATKPTVSRIMRRLIDKKLLLEKKHPRIKNAKRYLITPYLLYRGKMMSRELKEKFDEVKDLFYKEWENNKEIREQINMDLFESENILEIIEEAIVNECYNDQYIN